MTTAEVRPNRGFHPTIEERLPHVVIDTCMQIWPDADLASAHLHGADIYGVTAWHPHASLDQALEDLMYWHLMARKHETIKVITSVDDIRAVKAAGHAGLLLAAQDGDLIDKKLHRVELLYRLGLRMMLPAYNNSNQICDGCLDRTDSGLTRFGELFVDEANRVGLLLDCTHVGRRATLEMIERSAVPCVFSHSNPRGVVENPRNIDDEQIKAVAARGGVIGLAPWGPLLFKPGGTKRPTVDDFIEHIDYIAQLLGGVDNIGLGTDFSLGTYGSHDPDPWGEPKATAFGAVAAEFNRVVPPKTISPLRFADGFDSYPEVFNFVDKLKARGYDEAATAKILGENFIRVFAQVWK
jgi:membrane dipeptidase